MGTRTRRQSFQDQHRRNFRAQEYEEDVDTRNSMSRAPFRIGQSHGKLETAQNKSHDAKRALCNPIESSPDHRCTKLESSSQVKMSNVKIVYPWKLGGILKFQGKVYGETEFITGDVYFVRSSDEKEPLIFNK